MPRSENVPKLQLHRYSGRYFCKVPRGPGRSPKWVYFGRDKAKARELYDQFIAEWLAAGRVLSDDAPEFKPGASGTVTVADVAALFWLHHIQEQGRFLDANGEPTSERHQWRTVLLYLTEYVGDVPVAEFKLSHLRAARQRLVERDLSRGTIARYVRKWIKAFDWVEANFEEDNLVPDRLPARLKMLDPLPANVGKVRDRVMPVPEQAFEMTLEELDKLSPSAASMARLQWHTGMRPGEVMHMTVAEIEFNPPGLDEELRDKVALYEPQHHKTKHHGKRRVVVLGPLALAELRRWLRPGQAGPIFVRDDSGEPWDLQTYRRAIHGACKQAGIPAWSPNRLRHSAATRIRSGAGLDAAQLALGHSSAAMTERYAELDLQKAIDWARKHG